MGVVEKLRTAKIVLIASGQVGAEVARFLIEELNENVMLVVGLNKPEPVLEMASNLDTPVQELRQLLLSPPPQGRKILINAMSAKILPTSFLAPFALRVNLHPSFLPWGRGSHSATWAIRERSPFGCSLVEMTSSIDAGTVLAQRLIPFSLIDSAKVLRHQANLGLIGLFREYWINQSMMGQGEILKPHEEGSYHTRAETKADRFKEDKEIMSLGELVNWVKAHDFSPESTAVICVGDRKYAITLQLTPLQGADGE